MTSPLTLYASPPGNASLACQFDAFGPPWIAGTDRSALVPSAGSVLLLALAPLLDKRDATTSALLGAASVVRYEQDPRFRTAVDERRRYVEELFGRLEARRDVTEHLLAEERFDFIRFLLTRQGQPS